MRRTKIVATIGPSCDDYKVLREMFIIGVDVARLNFSHGSHEEHKKRIENIKKIRDELNIPIAIMLDTKGPEIRLGTFKDSMRPVLKAEEEFILTAREVLGDETISQVSYKNLPKDMKVGARILIDDGLISLKVRDIKGEDIYTVVENGGEISGHKGVNVPDTHLELPSLTEKDIEDLKFGVEMGVDFIAASFVRSKEDINDIRKVLEDAGDFSTLIISKIESKKAMDNIDDIIEASDGIMVARGDLGVEIETEVVPIAQKQIIEKCNLKGKAVITATQMLDSMIRNPRPTRAEANDVANAVLDGTSAVMLSGESAAGKYPLESVRTMKRIIEVTENSMDFSAILNKKIEEISNTTTNAIGKSTCTMARDLGVNLIITATTSGQTSRAISKFRPENQILAATPNEKVRRQLNLEWGVKSIKVKNFEDTDLIIKTSFERAMEENYCKAGDKVIITAGVPAGLAGSTNLIKIENIAHVIAKGTGFGDVNFTGRALVVKNYNDLINKFKDGDIIVAKGTDKEMIKFLERAGGIVTEISGYTSHGAVVGVSLGIPTIVGTENIREKIKTGDLITLNPKEGTITR
ncbi:pyruvate kinase [Peptoniphilus raoultii]|uniref:pyruvate kinase n=1 Tax=Peptoniphilus raoultii TaxID=1776387 RepID=UPI0008D98BFE|nr:pyruvate kinase [Peptoniphilus raoultii]